jgi:predicted transcriptional regulator
MIFKRSKLEIYLDVLNAIRRGVKGPTRIMYSSNLSWEPLMKILSSLVNQELILCKKQGSHSIYVITSKGKNVLNYFKEAENLIKIK